MDNQRQHEIHSPQSYDDAGMDSRDKAILCRVSNILDVIPDAVITADPEGTVVSCNSAVHKIFGYASEEFTGMPVSVIIPEMYRRLYSELLKRMGEPDGFRIEGKAIELAGQKKDGTQFPAELFMSTWHSGGKRYLTFIVRNITERKMEDAAVLESRQVMLKEHEELNRLFKQIESIKNEWERTVDSVGAMVILTDNHGRIRRCNRAFKDFTGKAYPDILGKVWDQLLFEHKVETGIFYRQGIEIFHRPTGRWFIINSYPFEDVHANEISGEAITFHDSTELKGITAELEEKNAEIEKAYSELKAVQSQLLQQEKMASIGQLAAGIAHEINNPIGFISSNLGSLGKYLVRLTEFIKAQSEALGQIYTSNPAVNKLEEKRKQLKLDYIIPDIESLIKESLDGADRVRKIVQDLKSFSRVEETEYKPADINAGLESTINIVWNELKYKATLKKEYGDIPLTRCNPGRLNQVFMNLLVNAAQAIEKQGEIRIKTWKDDGAILVSVSDTGCGIPGDKLTKIFEPFFTTKEAGRGTGLGLSIAYDIIKKHNGNITVDSEVGKGTTFTLRIPVVD